MKRIGWISCDALLPMVRSSWHPLVIEDDMPVVRALMQRGYEIQPIAWEKTPAHTLDCDGYLVRTPWNYQEDAAAFLSWLGEIEAKGAWLAHDSALVRWNIQKSYLAELAGRGAKVIPTRYLKQGETRSFREIAEETGWSEVVLKPVIAAGGVDTYRIQEKDFARFEEDFSRVIAKKEMMLQPFLHQVLEEGEWSLIFFEGSYSHSVLKKPRAGEFRVQDDHGGSVWMEKAQASLQEAAKRILDSMTQRLLYARVDGIVVDGEFLLIELEAIEPELFFRADAEAAERFAEAIVARYG